MFRSRIAILGGIFALLFLIVFCRLTCIQIVRGSELEGKAVEARIRKQPLPARRGRIVDRLGTPLAYDVPGFDLFCQVGYFIRGTALGSLAGLSNIFDARGSTSEDPRYCFPRKELLPLKITNINAIRSTEIRESAKDAMQSLLSCLPRREFALFSGEGAAGSGTTLGEFIGPDLSPELLARVEDRKKDRNLWTQAAILLTAVRRTSLAGVLSDPSVALDTVLRIRGEEVSALPGSRLRNEARSRLACLLGVERDLVDEIVRKYPAESVAIRALGTLDDARERMMEECRATVNQLSRIAKVSGRELSELVLVLDRVWFRADLRVRSRVGEYLTTNGDAATPRGLSTEWAARDVDYPFRRERLFKSIPYDAVLTVFSEAIPGLVVEQRSRREIRSASDLQLIGWTGAPDEARIVKNKARLSELKTRAERGDLPLLSRSEMMRLEERGLAAGDSVGSQGLERTFEEQLRGRRGYRFVLRDRSGRCIEVLEERPAVQGEDLALTVDVRLQDLAVKALDERKGAVVILGAGTGEVLCLASSPGFDLDSFRQNFDALQADERKPLLHRAVRIPGGYFPGSTFKVVLAVAGLEEGIITDRSTFQCGGSLRPGSTHTYKCLGTHGTIALHRAMARSCNVYFYRLGEKLGPEKIKHWAEVFGFGQKTGIGVYEDAGEILSPTGRRWGIGDTWHLSIGQKNITVTPLQVAQMMSVIAQGGELVQPRLVPRSASSNRSLPDRIPLGISRRTLTLVQKALEEVVETGTASSRGLMRYRAAGKTGTAEVGPDRIDSTWFVGYAPAEAPKVVVTVFLESTPGGTGETVVPIAREMFEAYFSSLRQGE